jgi:PAS domain S-box-containing protein
VSSSNNSINNERVLILAPTGRDAELTCAILERSGMKAQACRDVADVVHQAGNGCGAVVLAEETLGTTSVQTLTELLSRQPSWSEIPICIIAGAGQGKRDISRRLAVFNSAGSVTVLERPFRPDTLVNTLKVALRSRRRQFQVRDLLEERTALGERFRLMAESMPQKVFTAQPDGEIDYVNQQWIEFIGPGFKGIKGWDWSQIVHPDEREETIRHWKCSVETGAPFQIEHRFRRHDNVYCWHLSRANALKDAHGKILLWIGSNTDIESQKQAAASLEQLVQQRTASLEETNQQLEAFCYTIAHDLRAPLRAQQGFSSVLLEEFGEVLGPHGRDYAERIRKAALRLDALVNDLLAYSRISRADVGLTRVNLQKAVSEVCKEMAFDIQAAKATVQADPFELFIMGHELTLKIAITNLVSNAIKFLRPGIPPEVRIRAEERGCWVRLWIEDNGIGIAPEHREQIFGVFTRLHKSGQHPGTGVGLAIVQKGVERMGGRVGVESNNGAGSRFWIELEKAAAGVTKHSASAPSLP